VKPTICYRSPISNRMFSDDAAVSIRCVSSRIFALMRGISDSSQRM
jgi:hypothetical protein